MLSYRLLVTAQTDYSLSKLLKELKLFLIPSSISYYYIQLQTCGFASSSVTLALCCPVSIVQCFISINFSKTAVKKYLKTPISRQQQWRSENAKRRRGRCRTRWRDAVECDARLAARIHQDVESMASDRAQWRDVLALLVS